MSQWPDSALRYHKLYRYRQKLAESPSDGGANDKCTQRPSEHFIYPRGTVKEWVVGSMYGDIDHATTNQKIFNVPKWKRTDSCRMADHTESFKGQIQDDGHSVYQNAYDGKPNAKRRRIRRPPPNGSFTGGFVSDKTQESLCTTTYRKFNKEEISPKACKIIGVTEFGINPTRSKTTKKDFQSECTSYRPFDREEKIAARRSKKFKKPEVGKIVFRAKSDSIISNVPQKLVPSTNVTKKVTRSNGLEVKEIQIRPSMEPLPPLKSKMSSTTKLRMKSLNTDSYRGFNVIEQRAASRLGDYMKNKIYSW